MKNALSFSPLRARLMALVMLAMLPVMVFVLYLWIGQRRHAGLEVQKDALRVANLAAANQERLVEGARQLLMVISRLPEVRAGDVARCNVFFADLLKRCPVYASFGTVAADGTIRSSAIPFPKTFSNSDLTWFQRTRDRKDFAVGDYQISRTANKPTLNFGYPILGDAGEFQGAVFAALDLNWMSHLASQARLPAGASVLVIDSSGMILARHPDPEKWVGRMVTEAPILKAILEHRGEGTEEVMGPDKVMRLCAFTHLRGMNQGAGGAHVMVGIPVDTAYAGPRRVLRRNLIWLSGVALLALCAAWFLGDVFVMQRFRALLHTTSRLRAGDLSARTGLGQVKGEMGELAHAVDEMASSLERRVQEAERAEELLRDSERRFRDIFEFSPDAILVEDYQGKVLNANLAACRLYRVERGELIGKNAADLSPESMREEIVREFPEWSLGKISAQESWCRTADGESIPVEIRASRIEYLGRPALLFHVRDVTQRKNTESELLESNRQLAEALEQIEASQDYNIRRERLHAVGSMASGIAHDFNNALSPIIGFTELLLRPGGLEDRERTVNYLRIIHTAASDSAKVIARLREFYRHNEEGEKMAPVVLENLVSQVVSLTEPKWKTQAMEKGIDILMKTDLRHVPLFQANETALREMLANLVFNAADAIRKKGTITLRTHAGNGSAVIQVIDTGVGMSESVRARCFEPFFSTKKEQGTGLGLSMAYGVVQRHDGSIDIQSDLGKGTTVTISLPLNREMKPEDQIPISQQSDPAPLRILVVEDDPLVREVIAAQLTEAGHKPETADDGHEALAKFKAEIYDLVVTDRAMPGMNGDELAIAVKGIRPSVPVIMLTGFGDMMGGEEPGGVDLVVCKPFTFKTLCESVAKVVKKQP